MLVYGLTKPAVNAIWRAVLEMTRREVGLDVGHSPARDVVLVVVLACMVAPSYFLVLLVMLVLMLVVLVVLERLAEIHLHGVVLLAGASVHHDVVGLVPMALVEHAELLRRRLAPGRPRRGGGIGVGERYAAASGG